jgi:hypothetical protein
MALKCTADERVCSNSAAQIFANSSLVMVTKKSLNTFRLPHQLALKHGVSFVIEPVKFIVAKFHRFTQKHPGGTVLHVRRR